MSLLHSFQSNNKLQIFREQIVHNMEVVRKFDPEPHIDMQKMFDAGVWHGHKVRKKYFHISNTMFRLAL